MTWFAIIARPQCEPDVLAGLARNGYAAWLPMAWVERRHARRVVALTVPLFTGHVFLDLRDGECFEAALRCLPVINIVRTMFGMPWPIGDRDMDRVRRDVGPGGIKDLRPRTMSEHVADDRPLKFKMAGPTADPVANRAALDFARQPLQMFNLRNRSEASRRASPRAV